MAVSCHPIRNKNRNRSINQVNKLEYGKWLIYKQSRQDLDLGGYSIARYSEKCFTQIYKAWYGDAMLVPDGQVTETSVIEFCHRNEMLLL